MTKSAFSRKQDHLRKLLMEARKARGLTQTQLAAKLGRPQSFVSKYERADRRLDVVEFLDVARALNINPIQIIADLDGRRS